MLLHILLLLSIFASNIYSMDEKQRCYEEDCKDEELFDFTRQEPLKKTRVPGERPWIVDVGQLKDTEELTRVQKCFPDRLTLLLEKADQEKDVPGMLKWVLASIIYNIKRVEERHQEKIEEQEIANTKRFWKSIGVLVGSGILYIVNQYVANKISK